MLLVVFVCCFILISGIYRDDTYPKREIPWVHESTRLPFPFSDTNPRVPSPYHLSLSFGLMAVRNFRLRE